MHQRRNMVYHVKVVMLPTRRDLEVWSNIVSFFIMKVTGINPFEYFKTKSHERVSVNPVDLEYVAILERSFRKKPHMRLN